MRTALVTTLTGVALLSAGAWMRIDTPLTVQPESRVWVEGTSTTKSWSCKAPAFDADIIATSADAAAAVAGFGSFNAQVAEVSLEQGKVKVHRVVCVVDCP